MYVRKTVLRTRRREYTVVLLFFLITALLFTWPLILHIHNGILGGYGDPLLNTWIMSWDAKAVFSTPTQLFQPNILYPSLDALTYSEHLLTIGILAAPIYHPTGNPVLAYNLLLLFGLIFSGFGCYLLVKELTASRWGGLAAGLLVRRREEDEGRAFEPSSYRKGALYFLILTDYSQRLPCDMSRDQSLRYPVLIRPSSVPGEYRLFMALHDPSLGVFGLVYSLDVIVMDSVSGE